VDESFRRIAVGVSRREILSWGATALPASALLATTAWAQNRQPPGVAGAAAANPDPLLAAQLLIVGRKQIGKCQLAAKRLQSEEARNFAQAEIEEHQTIQARLKELGFTYPSSAGAQTTAGRVQPLAGDVTVGNSPLPLGAAPMILVEHEIADQCLATFKAVNDRREGADLDRAFIGDQLFAHYALFDQATVFRKHASEQMQPVLEEGLPIIQRHIATLEKLMAGLAQS